MAQITSEIVTGLAKSNDDFGFEMRIGRDLRSIPSLRVSHAETYVDPRTQTERHFDYQCVLQHEWRRLALAIECKNLFVNSPVVVCGHKRIRSESFHDMVFAGRGTLAGRGEPSRLLSGAVSEVCAVGPVSELYSLSNPTDNFVGKSVFRPKPPVNEAKGAVLSGFTITREKDDYDRWNQAVGSAGAMAINSLCYDGKGGGQSFSLTVTLPVFVVPDQALWQVEFDENGEITGDAVQVDQTTVFRDHRIATTEKRGTQFYRVIRISHVHFVTVTGLMAWLRALNSPATTLWWDIAFPESKAQEIVKRFTVS